MTSISAREFEEWKAYECVFGSLSVAERVDDAAALIAERITNMLKHKGKNASIDDFTPKYGTRKVDLDGEINSQSDDSLGS